MRICRLDGRGVTWRITYLLDPRRKAKRPARHELLACVRRHLLLAGLRPVHDNAPDRLPAWMDGTGSATSTVRQFDTSEARRRVVDTLVLLDGLAVKERETLTAGMRVRAVAEHRRRRQAAPHDAADDDPGTRPRYGDRGAHPHAVRLS